MGKEVFHVGERLSEQTKEKSLERLKGKDLKTSR